jgi:hypothetical protein
MTGISKVLVGVLLAAMTPCLSGLYADSRADLQDFSVSGVQIGVSLHTAKEVLKGIPERRDLSSSEFEIKWPGSTSVVFKKPSDIASEISGPVLAYRNQKLAWSGMPSEQFLPRMKPLSVGEAVVVGPENHSWAQSPINKMAYCNLHYRFGSGRLSVLLEKNRIRSFTLLRM